jgi:hypothetical protein
MILLNTLEEWIASRYKPVLVFLASASTLLNIRQCRLRYEIVPNERQRNGGIGGRETHEDISLYIVLNLPPLKLSSIHMILVIPASSSAAVVDRPPGPAPMTIASSVPVIV